MTDGYSEEQLLDDGYAIFDPPTTHNPMRGEPQERYFGVIVLKPASDGDPIPFLAAIYRGELVEAYWRGTREEAEDAFSAYLASTAND